MSQHQCCCPDTNMFVNVKNMSDIRSYNSVSNFDSECQFPDSSNISARNSVPTSFYSSFMPFLTTWRMPTSLILSWRRLTSTAPLQRSETSTTPSLRSWINFRFFTVGQAEVKVCYKKHIFCFLLNIISLCVQVQQNWWWKPQGLSFAGNS